jgi:hypothetical protein
LGPKVVPAEFVVLDTETPYNAILGRPWISAMGAVPSTVHQKLKYVCADGEVTVRGSQSLSRECFGGAISPTLTQKRPAPPLDAETQLAEASKLNQTLLAGEGRGFDSPKRKIVEGSTSSSSKQRLEA